MRYEWVIFDADGTLFDYDRAESAALAGALAEIGQRSERGLIEAYREINGRLWRAFERGQVSPEQIKTRRFELLFASLGIESDAVAFGQRYLDHLAQATYLLEGAEEVLEALRGQVGLALISNGLQAVQRPRLARSTIGDYFDVVVISEEVGASKPSPRIFEVAFEHMGHPSKDAVLMVGDSLTADIQGGSDYGIDTCWFNPHGRPRRPDPQVGPDVDIRYEIERLEALLAIVGVQEA